MKGSCAILLVVTIVALITTSVKGQANKAHHKENLSPELASWYFKPSFFKGQKLANIYSRTISYSGEGFEDIVKRISGTSSYEVLDPDKLKPVFQETDLYDGRPSMRSKALITVSGLGVYDGKVLVNSSASGLMISELVWGALPQKIHEGDKWEVNLKQAWELGGPGVQTVTVMQLDSKNHTVMLKREGTSEGFYDGEAKSLTVTTKDGRNVKADMTPGTSHWEGYTLFKNGIIIGDELMVVRTFTLSGEGLEAQGHQREYILLNAMPAEGIELTQKVSGNKSIRTN